MWCLALATSDCLLLADINPLNAELNPIRHLLALVRARHFVQVSRIRVNPLNAELNPIRHLLALVGARHFVHVRRIRVNRNMVVTRIAGVESWHWIGDEPQTSPCARICVSAGTVNEISVLWTQHPPLWELQKAVLEAVELPLNAHYVSIPPPDRVQ